MSKLRTRQKKNDPIFPTDYGEKKPGLLRVYPQRSERRRARCPQVETTKMLSSLSWQRTPVSAKFWSSESNNLSARHYSDLTMSDVWLRLNYRRWHCKTIVRETWPWFDPANDGFLLIPSSLLYRQWLQVPSQSADRNIHLLDIKSLHVLQHELGHQLPILQKVLFNV